MTRVIELDCEYSAGVLGEIASQEKYGTEHRQLIDAKDAYSYFSAGGSDAPFQYESLRQMLPSGSSILDVGVGLGQSSVFLASFGYRVTALEPIPHFCEIINSASVKYDLDITVVRGVGESIAKIGSTFDAIIFNSSLHHCDDPAVAIQQAYDSLRPGGQLFLVNENYLKPWRSEEEFQRLLISDPVGMGHYGGNEHSYHNWKYKKLLSQVFQNSDMLLPRSQLALDAIEHALTIRIDGKRIHSTNRSIALRLAFYILREKLYGSPRVYRALAAASLLPVIFHATKR